MDKDHFSQESLVTRSVEVITTKKFLSTNVMVTLSMMIVDRIISITEGLVIVTISQAITQQEEDTNPHTTGVVEGQ